MPQDQETDSHTHTAAAAQTRKERVRSEREAARRRSRPGPGSLWTIAKRLTVGSLYLCLIAAALITLFLLYLRAQPLPPVQSQQTTQIYDAHGELIDRFFQRENRVVVKLDEISPHMWQATVAIEDRRFYDHFGLDPRGIARAVLTDLRHMSKVEGASTITQQLARNLYLTLDKTWNRKIREAVYAIQLEMRYSKDDILEKYLNEIYYGHSAYGVEAASQLFFGKSASELTLAESALLAGVPKGPRFFSPYMDRDNAKSRQWVVLSAMVASGFISEKEAKEAYRQPLEYLPLEGDEPSKAPYFQDYVVELAQRKLGLSSEAFSQGGYRIYTSLDLRAQQIAKDAVDGRLKDTDLQAALIAIDPRSGHIKAMVGGRNYNSNQFNRVFSTSRQPGSSFKPFVYLTALESGRLTAVDTYRSEPTVFTYDKGRKTYMPSNFGDQYPYDEIDMRQAIRRSDNIYAVNTIMDVGAARVIETARRLGVDSPMKPVPSLALGTFPVSPFDMAAAFAAFAHQGVQVEPTAILRIEDADGEVLYEAAPTARQVVKPAHAYVLTNLLTGIFDPGGTGYRVADMLKRPVAAKTGTTNTDAWMVGYTPELSTAVWIGYDQGRVIDPVESHLASPIFAEFMSRTLEPVPPKLFPVPEGVVSVYIDPESGKLATADCPDSRLEAFVHGTEPTEYCSLHVAPAELPEPLPTDDTSHQENSWWQHLRRWWVD